MVYACRLPQHMILLSYRVSLPMLVIYGRALASPGPKVVGVSYSWSGVIK